MIKKTYILFIFTMFSYSFGEVELSSNLVAEWFRYDGQLIVKDVTKRAQKQIGEDLIWSEKYYSKDNTFAPVQIALARGGSILNQSLRESLKNRKVEYLEINGKHTGIAYDSGFGPGGSSFTTILSSTDNDLDLILKLTMPGDPPLDRTANPEYLEVIFDASILEMLQKVGAEAISYVETRLNNSVQKKDLGVEPQTKGVEQQVEIIDDKSFNLDVEEPIKVVTPEPSEEPIEKSSNWWLWLIGAAVFVGGVLMFRRKK